MQTFGAKKNPIKHFFQQKSSMGELKNLSFSEKTYKIESLFWELFGQNEITNRYLERKEEFVLLKSPYFFPRGLKIKVRGPFVIFSCTPLRQNKRRSHPKFEFFDFFHDLYITKGNQKSEAKIILGKL